MTWCGGQGGHAPAAATVLVAVTSPTGGSAVIIELHLTSTDPPSGRIHSPDGGSDEFDGWLGLLAVLAERIDPPSERATTGQG